MKIVAMILAEVAMRVVIMLTVCYLMAGMAHRAQEVAVDRLVSQAQQDAAPTPVVVTGSIMVAER